MAIMIGRVLSSVVLLVSVAAFPASAEEGPDIERHKYRGGTLRVGGFVITKIKTSLALTSNTLPVGTRFELSEDLGLQDSMTIGRMMLGYRFSRHHRFDFGYYNIDRDATKVLDKTIEIGDSIFPIYAEAYTRFDSDIYKAAYTWMFHEDEKVSLGLSAGLHIIGMTLEVNTTDPLLGIEEKNGVTAPLPVLGFRLTYRATRKLFVIAAVDHFFLDYDQYAGSLVDLQAFVEHRTFKHVGFGVGLNNFSFDLEVNDDQRFWDVQNVYRGYVVYLSFFF